jgi:hypothetical protein
MVAVKVQFACRASHIKGITPAEYSVSVSSQPHAIELLATLDRTIDAVSSASSVNQF